MDSSYWVNLNENIKVEATKKQYFSRYLWRLVYEIDKVNLASDKHIADVVAYVRNNRNTENERKKYPNMLGGNDGWYGYSAVSHPYRAHWEGIDELLLDRVRTVMKTFKHKIKFRTEGNRLQVYAENEQDLQAVSQAISANEHMTVLCMPKPGTEDALRNNVVFMNTIDYKYKIILRDGNYTTDTKQSVLAQLRARDDVKIPYNLIRELGKKYTALWGGYFYSNDDSIATILTLISPGIVGKIHPIDHLQ